MTLDIPSLAVSDGEIFVLIGPNGSGKSTLLQTLSALIKPSRGRIRFRGQTVGRDIPVLEYRRKLAMVLQEPLLFDTSVYLNVASGLKMRGMKKKDIAPIVLGNLERFGIADLKERSARTLSGGEARRVSIARAFATNPEVLLLDEPFSALDPIIRETLMEDLESVLRDTRMTTIFVTHDRGEALRLATRLGVMRAGTILQTGSTHDVIHHPANEFVASLVGVETILRGVVIQNGDGLISVRVGEHTIRAAGDAKTGTSVALCIRPEHVRLSTVSDGPADAFNRYPGRVEKVTLIGFYHKVQVDCGFSLVTYVTGGSPLPPPRLHRGEAVLASFSSKDVHVIGK